MKLVYFDLETDSLELDCQIIQIGAVAVKDNEIVETFERKLMFDITLSEPKALEGNSYREDIWEKEAVPVEVALNHLSNFLSTYADIKRLNPKTKRHFKVADLWGHNAITFDYPRLQRTYQRENERIAREVTDPEELKKRKIFFPANYTPGDTIQVAKQLEVMRGKRFEGHKLSELAEVMGIQHDPNVTHDALYDAKLTFRLHQLLMSAIRDTVQRQFIF